MVVAVDTGGMAVGKGELDGVVAYRVGGFRGGLRLEHGEGGGGGWAGCGEGDFLFAFVVASSARALVAKVGKVVVAGVAVRPSDIYAFARGDVDFHASGLFALVDGSGHGEGRQCTVYRRSIGKGKDRRFNEGAEIGARRSRTVHDEQKPTGSRF
jgi:hypothetical protein